MSLRKIAEKFFKNRDVSNPGDKVMYEYEEVIEDGERKVIPVREIDIQAEIESHRDSVDIHKIIERFVAGDQGALERAQTFYADVSEMPVKLQDVLSVNQNGMNIFKMLPADLREMYDNDYLSFINHPEIIDEYIKSKNPQIVDEKVEKSDGVEDKQ